MAGSHSHRRQRQSRSAARVGIAGGVTGVLGVAAAAVLIAVVRAQHGGHGTPTPRAAAQRTRTTTAGAGVRGGSLPPSLRTGDRLDVTTPEGFSYSLAAVEAGTSVRPLTSTRTTPPRGTTLGYVDYVLTNTGTAPALLDFPADLFVRRSLVPGSARSRCMPQPGAPADMCTLPNHTDVVNTLGSAPPTSQDGDTYIPPGAGYLVRIATDLPIGETATVRDLGLYVWNPRFAPGRRALAVPLP